MRRSALVLITMVLLILAAGCSQKEPASEASGAPATPEATAAEKTITPEQLGELGAKIEKTPDQAPALLSEYGLTEETFEQEIRKVTEDPEASKRYATAYEKAKA